MIFVSKENFAAASAYTKMVRLWQTFSLFDGISGVK
jgi:hypothetical protein